MRSIRDDDFLSEVCCWSISPFVSSGWHEYVHDPLVLRLAFRYLCVSVVLWYLCVFVCCWLYQCFVFLFAVLIRVVVTSDMGMICRGGVEGIYCVVSSPS